LAFTAGGAFTKTSAGLTRPGSTVLMFLCFAAGAAFQAQAMRHAEMGVAYLLSLGLEVVLAFAFAYLFFAESVAGWKVVGVASSAAGMVLLHLGGAAAEEPPCTASTDGEEKNPRRAEGVCRRPAHDEVTALRLDPLAK